jgi:putative hydrolase of the HAD superfamily
MLRGRNVFFFDAGHTLVEPDPPVAVAYLAEARSVGIELPEEEFRDRLRAQWSRLNTGYRMAADDLASSEELERQAWYRFTNELARPFPDLASRHEEWFARLIDHFDSPRAWRPVKGASEVLQRLRDLGMTAGVVSNWHAALHGILASHGMTPYLQFTLTSAEVGRKKPHPHMFETALRAAGARPEQVVHIGDSWSDDVEGAQAAGILPIHFQRDESFVASRPTATIRCLTELLSQLG